MKLFDRAKGKKGPNIFDLCPVQGVPSAPGENECVVLNVPKFSHPFLVKWLVPRLKTPHFTVRLDKRGSYVWSLFDGKRTAAEVIPFMEKEFGDEPAVAADRLARFLLQLKRGGLVRLEPRGSVRTNAGSEGS